MGPSPDVIRQRIAELCADNRCTYATLSRLLGRQDGYIARHIREAVPYELAIADRDKLARFFGIPGQHLGAPARMDDRRAFAERRRYKPNYRTVLRRAT
ncbi:phage repressor protein [Sphingomonas pituitosa]|uniref:phage repressor protein n=1 Tax=Sphingomonas pituitosa TaxID=99597 RepID=UPI000837990D|nr:phage repressor protein [Sphingomonas pituitosa]